MSGRQNASTAWFRWLHDSRLIYNQCWEDPRLDRQALALGPDDTVVVITSAGCNALDYALDAPRHVYAVDINPRQNALLELKQAGIRALDYDTFFDVFGRGRSRQFTAIYHDALREQLSPWAASYWDRHEDYFSGRGWRPSLYFHGTTGFFARVINAYVDRVAGLRDAVERLIDATDLDTQREVYRRQVGPRLWRPLLRWTLGRDALLSLLAVPQPQREHLERDYQGGIAAFIEQRVESVFTTLPIADNYFWRVYLTGTYAQQCSPEYLKRENFARLKAGLVDRVSTETATLLGFLRHHQGPVSRFVLLDHMDWLCDDGRPALRAEWQQILERASPGARVIWRSGGVQTDFVDDLQVWAHGRPATLRDLLTYDRALAADLHQRDRVHTYGSFHIASLAGLA